jgi:hypothetical protein
MGSVLRMQTHNPHYRNESLVRNFNILTGIKFGNIRPMDVDGFIEIHNKLFIFIETKHGESPLHGAQKAALQRLTDAVHDPKSEKYSYLLVVSHNAVGDIDVASSIVTEYRHNGKWHTIANLGYTAYDFVYNLIEIHIGHDKI